MIYVFNKNKIVSYVVASFIVLFLFSFSTSAIPKQDIEIIKVDSNISGNNLGNNINILPK